MIGLLFLISWETIPTNATSGRRLLTCEKTLQIINITNVSYYVSRTTITNGNSTSILYHLRRCAVYMLLETGQFPKFLSFVLDICFEATAWTWDWGGDCEWWFLVVKSWDNKLIKSYCEASGETGEAIIGRQSPTM